METIDVLGDDAGQLARFFQLRQLLMGSVGLGIEIEHFVAIEIIEFLGMLKKKVKAQHFFRRIFIFLVIQSIDAAEVRNSAFRGYACAAKKNNGIAFVDHGLESGNRFPFIF